MEILISKLLALFVYPVGLLASALLAASLALVLGRPRAARVLVVGATLLIFVAGNSRFAYTLVRSLENDYPATAAARLPRADVIVVLGGGLQPPYPPRQHPHLGSGADRLLFALELYRAGRADRVLLSGGNVFPQTGLRSEAYYSRALLVSWGMPPTAIVLEKQSRNTIQNAEYSHRILARHGWRDVLLVTSAAHMPRAVLAFRHAGIEVTPAPTDYLAVDVNRPGILDWIPSSHALSLTTYALHEYLGRLWYRLRL